LYDINHVQAALCCNFQYGVQNSCKTCRADRLLDQPPASSTNIFSNKNSETTIGNTPKLSDTKTVMA